MIRPVGSLCDVAERLNGGRLGHNTVRGVAGASILNAELLKVEGLLPV